MEQIDDEPLPISYTMFYESQSFRTELRDEHDLVRRRLEAQDLFVAARLLVAF